MAVQQMLKEIREPENEKSINSRLGVGSPGEIRTPVEGSKGLHDCRYTTGLGRVL